MTQELPQPELQQPKSSEIETILVNWRRQELDIDATVSQSDEIRKWVIDYGQHNDETDYTDFVFSDPATGLKISASDAEGDPESVDFLKGRMLDIVDSNPNRDLEISFFEDTDDEGDKIHEVETSVLYKIPPSANGEDNYVVFPRREIHLLSGHEQAVIQDLVSRVFNTYVQTPIQT